MKAELQKLHDDHPELAQRIYRRWKDLLNNPAWNELFQNDNWWETLEAAGGFDGLVDDDEARILVRYLSPELRKALAFGPMPEPTCNVCHVLNRPELWANNTIVSVLLDYHDTTLRSSRAHTHGRWKGGPESYRRCCVIYEEAKLDTEDNPNLPDDETEDGDGSEIDPGTGHQYA